MNRKIVLFMSLLALSGCKHKHKDIAPAGEHIEHTKDISGGTAKITPSTLQAIDLPIPMKKGEAHLINLAWIYVMKKDYLDKKPTPINQNEARCQIQGRPAYTEKKIWLPELCYMVPVDMRDNKNNIVAHDIFMLGKDDIISIKPRYQDGNRIIASISISQESGKFFKIPFVGVEKGTFDNIYSMLGEVKSYMDKTTSLKSEK